MVSLSIQEDKVKENPINKRTVEEAEQIVNYFKSELKTMEEELSLDTWNKNMELYVILKIYLTYGVVRPSELIDTVCKLQIQMKDVISLITSMSKQKRLLSIITRTTGKEQK